MALFLDDNHQFCLDESPHIRARIRADLEAITEIILEAVPEASIVLSGSLAYGEARIGPDGLLPRSDYDLYIVVPRLLQVGRLLGSRSRCVQKLLSLTLATDLEIPVIWSPFIWRGLTHLPGILLAGSPAINPILEHPVFPYGDRGLCRAYLSLLCVLLGGADRGFLRKAVTTGLRAWLQDRAAKEKGFCLSDLYSFRGNLRYLAEHPAELAESWREMVESAILTGLGEPFPHGTVDPKTVLAFLRWVQGAIQLSPFRWAGLLYMVHQVKAGRSFIGPHRLISTYLTLASSLAEVCVADGVSSIPGEIMRGIERLAGQSCPTQVDADQKGWALAEMIALADANPHKIVIPRRERSVTNLTPHS
jgi:predicted nucleotidyltransferase